MKLVFVVTDDWYFVSHRRHLARAALAAGHEVHLVTNITGERSRLEADGIVVHELSFGRTVAGQLRNVGLVARLVRLYAEIAPDLAFHVAFLPIFYGSLAARRAGVAAVVNAVTGLGSAFAGRRGALRFALERGYGIASRAGSAWTLFQNEEDRALFLARGLADPGRTALVPGAGVDVVRFAPRPEPSGTPRVLYAGRMLWSKGVGVLVEACEILRARGIAHELVLAGEPHATNPDSIPQATLTAWARAGRARAIGRTNAVPELMASSHVVVLASWYREGLPLVLVEGAASGRALVTTDAPGCRDVVRDGVNGLVVPARNPSALADALAALLVDGERRRRLGARGRELVLERFAEEVVDEQVLALFARAVEGSMESAPRGR